jgi:hypothetical protein
MAAKKKAAKKRTPRFTNQAMRHVADKLSGGDNLAINMVNDAMRRIAFPVASVTDKPTMAPGLADKMLRAELEAKGWTPIAIDRILRPQLSVLEDVKELERKDEHAAEPWLAGGRAVPGAYGGSFNGTEPIERRREVHLALGSLEHEQERLTEQVKNLFAALTDVLMPQPPRPVEAANERDTFPTACTPLAVGIVSQARQARSSADLVAQMIERLQV